MELRNCVHIDEVLLNISDFTLRLDFQIVAGTLYAAAFLFGLLSNVFVIAAVIKYRDILKEFRNEFIGNLAMADLIICIVSVPVNAFIDFSKVWIFGSVACRIIPFLQGLCVLVSSFTLSAIAIDRYFRIVKSRKLEHITRSGLILGIWITSCVVSIPLAINSELKSGKNCRCFEIIF